MSEVLRKSSQRTFGDSRSATSLQGLESGLTHLDKLGGMTTDPSGQAVARANLSASQAREMGLLTSGTFGQPSSISSRSADLASSLASRLKQQLNTLGSTLYKLTWKVLVTPQGRYVPLLRASVLRTSEAEFTGWVTPTTRDWKDTPGMATTAGKRVRLDQLPRQAAYLLGWPTPTSQDAVRGVKPPRPHDTGVPLTQRVGQMDFGRMPTGYPSEIPNSALLNPAFSRWLLGLPPTWDDAAPTAMP